MTSERATLNAVPEQGSQRCEFRSPVACQEKRPAGITPPAFSCNCRLP